MKINHKLITNIAFGQGSWEHCKRCGAAYHSGFWWLSGYKSEIEPPCTGSLEEWRSQATEIELTIVPQSGAKN